MKARAVYEDKDCRVVVKNGVARPEWRDTDLMGQDAWVLFDTERESLIALSMAVVEMTKVEVEYKGPSSTEMQEKIDRVTEGAERGVK